MSTHKEHKDIRKSLPNRSQSSPLHLSATHRHMKQTTMHTPTPKDNWGIQINQPVMFLEVVGSWRTRTESTHVRGKDPFFKEKNSRIWTQHENILNLITSWWNTVTREGVQMKPKKNILDLLEFTVLGGEIMLWSLQVRVSLSKYTSYR